MYIYSTYSFDAQYRAMQGTVSQQSDATSVRGHVSSNVTTSLRSQVQRHHQALILDMLVQALQNTTGLTG